MKMKNQRKKYPIDIYLCIAWSIILLFILLLGERGLIWSVLGLPFFLFVPGYTLTILLFIHKKTNTRIDFIEKIALSLGLSILLIILIKNGLTYTKIGIYFGSVILPILLFVIFIGLITLYHLYKINNENNLLSNVTVSKSRSDLKKVMNIFLIICLVMIIITQLLYVTTAPKRQEELLEFYLFGPSVLVDPSIFMYNNTWWMFVASTGSKNCYLYYSDNLTDGWTQHPKSPIVKNDASKARPGGRCFVYNNNKIIRLAQNCTNQYGGQVKVFEVDIFTKTNYAEHEIPQSPILKPGKNGWNKTGMHTFDPWWTGDNWLCVTDGLGTENWSIGIYSTPILEQSFKIDNHTITDEKNNSPSLDLQKNKLIPNFINVSQDPFNIGIPLGIINPVLTANDITNVQASFVADPFLFYENNTWYMFFEVMISNIGHADIGLATSSDGLHWNYKQIVLSEGLHHSYPQVFKFNNNYYMIPDSNIKNEVRLYTTTNFPYNWTYDSTIIDGNAETIFQTLSYILYLITFSLIIIRRFIKK